MSAPIFRKVDPRLWDDDKFVELSDDAKLLWLVILTGPQTSYVPGLMTTGIGTLSEVLRKGFERVSEAFQELLKWGLIEHDPKRRVLRVPNAPRYNPPDNPNVLKGWFRVWQSAPESPLKYAHISSIFESLGDPSPAMKKAWDETFGTVPETLPETLSEGFAEPLAEPFGKQKQKQKQKQDQDHTLSAIASDGPTASEEPVPLELVPEELDPDRLTPERLVALWNEATGGRIREIDADRRRRLRDAIKRQPDLGWWRACFAKAAALKRTPQSDWLTLDWILGKGKHGWNAERVAEGVFDFRLDTGKRDITTGYVPYGAERDAQLKEVPSGDITHLF